MFASTYASKDCSAPSQRSDSCFTPLITLYKATRSTFCGTWY